MIIYGLVEKHKQNHMFKISVLIGYLNRQSWMKIYTSDFFLQHCRMMLDVDVGVIYDQTSSDYVVSNMLYPIFWAVCRRL